MTRPCGPTCAPTGSATSWRWPATSTPSCRPGCANASMSPKRTCPVWRGSATAAAEGPKDPRFYDWAFVHIDGDGPGVHSLLIRRNRAGELAFYLCWTPHPVPLSALVSAAGARWAVEETFQIGKGQVGLDHYQCRTWTAWHRFTVLAMAALAVLVAITAAQPPPPPGLAPLTVPETRRLLTTLTSTTTDPHTAIGWSLWRRRHSATAQTSHHKRRMIIESEHVNR